MDPGPRSLACGGSSRLRKRRWRPNSLAQYRGQSIFSVSVAANGFGASLPKPGAGARIARLPPRDWPGDYPYEIATKAEVDTDRRAWALVAERDFTHPRWLSHSAAVAMNIFTGGTGRGKCLSRVRISLTCGHSGRSRQHNRYIRASRAWRKTRSLRRGSLCRPSRRISQSRR